MCKNTRIKNQWQRQAFLLVCLCSMGFLKSFAQQATTHTSGNPVFPGWYADPEAAIFGNTYWIYPTYSDDYGNRDTSVGLTASQLEIQKNTINPQYLKQTFLNAFSSPDLIHWKKHPHVLDVKNVSWAAYSVWAPAITKKRRQVLSFFRRERYSKQQSTRRHRRCGFRRTRRAVY